MNAHGWCGCGDIAEDLAIGEGKDIRKQSERTGNNILNATNEEEKVRFNAYGESGLEESFGIQTLKYPQSYKEKLAYTGIQSEISAATNEIKTFSDEASIKMDQINELSKKLKTDPTNLDIPKEIQKLSSEIKPLLSQIDKRKAFITKLSDGTIDLSTIAKERDRQANNLAVTAFEASRRMGVAMYERDTAMKVAEAEARIKAGQGTSTAHPKFYLFDAGVFQALRPKGPLDPGRS